MNDEVCVEVRKRVEEKLKINEKRLNDHASRLDKLEQNQASVNTKIESLCDQIKQLVSVMKWYLGLTVGALVSFFFYGVQHNLFK